jgi:threonine dehydrogenase-like Zn-dependent dehydrogenase
VVTAPTDAVVRVVLAGVCGSDLWYYRGESTHVLAPSATSSSAWWSR